MKKGVLQGEKQYAATSSFMSHKEPQYKLVLVKEAGLKFSFVTHGATGSWLTMPLRSAMLRSGEFR